MRVTRKIRQPFTKPSKVSRVNSASNVSAVNTGYTEEGDTGVGSEYVYPLSAPKIAMVADEGVDQTSFGSIWWTLDRYGIEFTPLTIASINGGALQKLQCVDYAGRFGKRYFCIIRHGGISALKNGSTAAEL